MTLSLKQVQFPPPRDSPVMDQQSLVAGSPSVGASNVPTGGLGGNPPSNPAVASSQRFTGTGNSPATSQTSTGSATPPKSIFSQVWSGWFRQLSETLNKNNTSTVNYLGNGLTVVITTASLTAGGTQGSMTFTNGILTAQTQAT